MLWGKDRLSRCPRVNAKSCELPKKVGRTKDPETVNSVCVLQPLKSQHRWGYGGSGHRRWLLCETSTLLRLPGLDGGWNVSRDFSGGHQFPGSCSEQASQPAENSEDREGKCRVITGVLRFKKSQTHYKGPFKWVRVARDPTSGILTATRLSKNVQRKKQVWYTLY